jgi:4-hydroxybenzoate polyprenyltransferase
MRNQGGGRICYTREFIGFIKPEIGIFLGSVSALGYLLSNSIEKELGYLFMSVFFASITVYSFNHFEDKKEDLINKKRINYFVESGMGYYIVFFSAILSLSFILFLSFKVILIYLFWLSGGIFYSLIRLKRFFILKNLYTAFFMTLSFVMGIVLGESNLSTVYNYVISIFFIGLCVSLIGDLRDYYGDKLADVRTVPVVIGYERAKRIVCLILFSFLSIILILNLRTFIPSVLFISFSIFFLLKNDIKKTRLSLLFSIAFMLCIRIISQELIYVDI